MAKDKKDKNKRQATANAQNLLNRLEDTLTAKSKAIFFTLSALCLIFSVLFYNTKITEGGDDSTYLFAGYNYAKNFTQYYYSFNAPGYPMFLALPIALFGVNLFVLKALSILFNFIGFYFLYRAFEREANLPRFVFIPAMLILSVNAYIQYYANQTYNEAFYMLFQGLFIWSFVKVLQAKEGSLKESWASWLLLGFTLFMMSFVKNVAIVAVPAVILYFLLMKEFRNAIIALLAFLCVKLPFELLKKIIWGDIGQYGGQGDILMLKDPYDRSKGYEEMSGYVDRFFTNAQSFMSKRFYEILGFYGEQPPVDPKHLSLYTFLSFLFVAMLLVVFIHSLIRKNSLMLCITLYLGSMLVTSFVALQVRWDQARFMIIFLPLMLLVIFYFLTVVMGKYAITRNLFIVLALLFTFSSLGSSFKKINANMPVLAKNMKGDVYAGYTPDWVHFLQMSRWCADHLPETAYVASRKGPMSFVFANGKEFYPVYRIFGADSTGQLNSDSVLTHLKKEKVTHILDARLRLDPRKANGNYINTMTRLLEAIYRKYPEKIKQVHQIPPPEQPQIEPAYLYEITY